MIVMSEFIELEQIDGAVKIIRSRIGVQPRVGMILGSGLGTLAESVKDAVTIPYGDLPPWPVSTVEGHHGQLVIGKLEGQEVLVMQGRSHYYEGYSMPQIGFPVRVMQRLGVEILIVTNAAGAVNPNFEPGDVMLILILTRLAPVFLTWDLHTIANWVSYHARWLRIMVLHYKREFTSVWLDLHLKHQQICVS
jgi:hypothetical protein